MHQLLVDGEVVATSANPIARVNPITFLVDGVAVQAPGSAVVRTLRTWLSPPEFLLRFTSPERVAIRKARATDPIIDDWFAILDDQRLTQVDLALRSTQDGLAYLAGVELLDPARIPDILAPIVEG